MQTNKSAQRGSWRAHTGASALVGAAIALVLLMVACGQTQTVAHHCDHCLDTEAAGGGDAGSNPGCETWDPGCECYYIRKAH